VEEAESMHFKMLLRSF